MKYLRIVLNVVLVFTCGFLYWRCYKAQIFSIYYKKRYSNQLKTPKEALRIAMSYEIGDKYARSYKGAVSGSTGMAHPSPGGSLQIKTEPVSNIRGSRGQECQGDGVNIQIVEEVEHKIECKSPDVTIAINRTSPQNTDNDAQQEPSHAIFAKRLGTLRGLSGENDNPGGTTGWINPRG